MCLLQKGFLLLERFVSPDRIPPHGAVSLRSPASAARYLPPRLSIPAALRTEPCVPRRSPHRGRFLQPEPVILRAPPSRRLCPPGCATCRNGRFGDRIAAPKPPVLNP